MRIPRRTRSAERDSAASTRQGEHGAANGARRGVRHGSAPGQDDRAPDLVEDFTLKVAAFRAIRIFSLISGVGLLALWGYTSLAEQAPMATVVKRDVKPVPFRAPDRHPDYPAVLPTLDNISLISVKPEPGLVVVHLATPSTPATAVTEVVSAFDRADWELTLATGQTLLLGGAERGGVVVGVSVSPEPRKGTPVGWTTIMIYIQREADRTERVAPKPNPQTGARG